MQVFTSVTVNYLPKARVLAESVKRFHPEATFHLMLSDAIPPELRESPGPFDTITHVEELPIKDIRQWIFKHTLVELCTAVKGPFCQKLMAEHPHDPVFYFDPDIVVLSSLEPLLASLREHDILLTPHQTEPDSATDAIMDNEICSLRHGIYNLGFLGLAPTAEGRRFADWWADRLLDFCYADIENGLFTDQRWVDLAPAFFPTVKIHRDPGCNVATWNLTNRRVTGATPYNLFVNGNPLCFFHFSGFDSGAQKIMLDKFGKHSPALFELRDWYVEQCERAEQGRLGTTAWAYGCFDNGVPITLHQRLLYRLRGDVRTVFPDPFLAQDINNSYYHWYLVEVTGDPLSENPGKLRDEVLRLRKEVRRLLQAQEKLTQLNAAVLATNESILSDNSVLAKAVDDINAVNQMIASAHAELCEAKQTLLSVNAETYDKTRSLAGELTLTQHSNESLAAELTFAQRNNESLAEELSLTQRRNDSLAELVSALQQHARGLGQELEGIRRSRSYRAARKMSALVNGVLRRSA